VLAIFPTSVGVDFALATATLLARGSVQSIGVTLTPAPTEEARN
jgi:hypothetical protein